MRFTRTPTEVDSLAPHLFGRSVVTFFVSDITLIEQTRPNDLIKLLSLVIVQVPFHRAKSSMRNDPKKSQYRGLHRQISMAVINANWYLPREENFFSVKIHTHHKSFSFSSKRIFRWKEELADTMLTKFHSGWDEENVGQIEAISLLFKYFHARFVFSRSRWKSIEQRYFSPKGRRRRSNRLSTVNVDINKSEWKIIFIHPAWALNPRNQLGPPRRQRTIKVFTYVVCGKYIRTCFIRSASFNHDSSQPTPELRTRSSKAFSKNCTPEEQLAEGNRKRKPSFTSCTSLFFALVTKKISGLDGYERYEASLFRWLVGGHMCESKSTDPISPRRRRFAIFLS